MTPIYLFAAIVGWPFVLFFMFFGADADVDAGVDASIDVDADASFDLDAGDAGWSVSDFLSVRSIIFFLAFFGGTGLLMGGLGANRFITLVSAIGLGVLGVFANATLYRYLKRSQSDSEIHDHQLRGSQATVVLPIDDDHRGRIAVDFDDHRLYFVARPYRSGGDGHGAGDRVVIIEIERGTALVAAMDAFDL